MAVRVLPILYKEVASEPFCVKYAEQQCSKRRTYNPSVMIQVQVKAIAPPPSSGI